MATDTTAPIEEPVDSGAGDAEKPDIEEVGYVQPTTDVPALTALLDGRYAEIRNLEKQKAAAQETRGVMP